MQSINFKCIATQPLLHMTIWKIIRLDKYSSFYGVVSLAMMLGNMNNVCDKPLFLCSSAMMAHTQRQEGRWWKD